MPLFSEVAVVRQSNKSKKSKSWNPFNALTAALAKCKAEEDIKKEKKNKK